MKSFLLTFACTCALISSMHAQADNRYCSGSGIPYYILDHGDLKDGPATLPQRCVNTAPDNMPSPGGVVSVAAGASLMAAYNSALCGTTIRLAHGASWVGPFAFASKGCDDKHWVTIESDGKLPGPGTRVSPANSAQMAKFVAASGRTTMGDHLRFIGIEWAKKPGPILYVFVSMDGANKVSIERNYFHGNPHEEANHGVVVGTGTDIAVTDSYFADFHCIAIIGACSDAQAISGGVGTGVAGKGPTKIVNNFLEASGEGVLFGGGGGDGCPADFEIRRNHFYKPISWNPSDPSYDGGTNGHPYIVKNGFELKNACRALIEGNVFENNWGGFSQPGYAVLFTPKSQSNMCPNCTVTDVTFRFNYIGTAAGVFVVGSGPSDAGGWSMGNHRLSIHDVVADNLQYSTCFACGQMLSEIASPWGPTNPPPPVEVLSDVSISHLDIISMSAAGELINIGSVPPDNSSLTPQASNISFTSSIVRGNNWGFYPTGGGANDCMNYSKWLPVDWWPTCFTGSSPFTGNLIVGYHGKGGAADWPSGNTLVPDWNSVGFVNFSGGDYHLVAGSPYAGMGADIDKVNAAIAGVR